MSAAVLNHALTAAAADLHAGWRDLAMCAGRADLMDPPAAVAAELERSALAVCRACPVRTDCRAWVISLSSDQDPGGVCGGLTADRRAAERRRHQYRRRALTLMPDGTPGKRCPACTQTKPPADFYRDDRRADGLSSYCRPCRLAANEQCRRRGTQGTSEEPIT